ncbi:MAG: GtrA family protein [Candidatus Helarchaeota archaeon]
MKNNTKESEVNKGNYYNKIEFLSIIIVIIIQTVLDLLIGTQYFITNALLSFSVVYCIKFIIDKKFNFYNKWDEFVNDNFFYVLYILIATGACVIYVAVQYILKYDILFPILAGGAALTIKKIVDQEYALFFKEHLKEIILYGFFAIFTTIIFWGVQYMISMIIGVEYYIIAGAIGLAIGYTVKFVLDKIYVFKKKFGSSSQQTMFYVLYILFGFISSVVNLGTQWVLGYYFLGGYNALGVLAGTIIGFFMKYLLDKFIVFRKKKLDPDL